MAALAYATVGVLPATMAVVLLLVAETWRGRVFAIAGLCLLALGPLVVRTVLHKTRRRIVLAGADATVVGGLLVLLVLASPDGHPLPGSPLRSEFLADARYRVFAIAALLPEIDQVKLGTYVAPVVDPIIDWKQARRIRAISMRHYRAMEGDPGFVALGTVLPYAYADEDAAHLFAYAPPHAPDERLPAVVFLHGSAGNFKAYFYLWKRFADEQRMAVVCPSFGFGNWYERGGVEAVERARTWAVTNLDADETRMFLVGLSNGGTGVTRAIASRPGAYRGIVLISGVLEDDVLRAVAQRGMPPMFVIHGQDDDRIHASDVAKATARLRARGATVQEWFVAHEDHFLFFDRDDEVLGRVGTWMKESPAAPRQ